MKKNKTLRTLTLLLSILFLLSTSLSIFSCAEKNKDPENSNEGTTAGDITTTEEGTTAEPKILPDLPEANYNGYTLKFLTRTSTAVDWLDWIPRDVYAENETGEGLNDAVYRRNVYIEDKYSVKITQTFTENFSTALSKAIKANDQSIDVAYPGLGDSPPFAQSGYFLDLNKVSNIDLTKPWWDQNAVNSLSVGGKLYMTSGDIMIINKDACPGIIFNKKLLQAEALEDPYKLVHDNQWTMEKLYDMCKNVSKDLNGDGEIKYTDDRYGFIGQRDTLIAFLNGADEEICSKDENDLPIITFGTERSISAMEGCYKIMYDQKIAHNAHHLEGKVTGIYPVSEEMFMADRALFMWVRLRIVQNLRSMETDFGILPMPKLESTQEKYGHTVNKYTGCAMAIPANVADPDMIGCIVEAMCAESKYSTMPAYYDISLKTKLSRDSESGEMLDIIFGSTIYDIGEIYNFGAFGGDLIYMSMKNDANIASKFDKSKVAMEKAIQKCIEKYEALP